MLMSVSIIMQLHAHSACRVCALESSSLVCLQSSSYVYFSSWFSIYIKTVMINFEVVMLARYNENAFWIYFYIEICWSQNMYAQA